MTPAKLNLFFAFFPYSGNGGISCQHPSIQRWFVKTILTAKADERIGDIYDADFSDTPITMTRNRAVKVARASGADVLVMVDSDQHPDLLVGKDPLAKPFFDSSFDFLANHYAKGPCVIGAPYCGPPPGENVYVFQWANWETDSPNMDIRLEQYSREQSTKMAGIQQAGALPTGCIMLDLRVFDWLPKPWFYYEYVDKEESEKASTEDVTCTRDIALMGMDKLGYNPVFCNWDAWAGHWKPKCVGKPALVTTEQISGKYREAILRNHSGTSKLVDVENLPQNRNWRQQLTQGALNGTQH